MCRRQPPDAGVDAGRLRHVAEGKEIVDGSGVEAAGQGGHAGQRRQFGAEHEAAGAVGGVIEWFLAQPVARQEQAAAVAIPQCEGELAIELPQAVGAETFPRVDDGFRIGVIAAEHMPEGCELRPQLGKIVNIAVEDDHHRAVLVAHRLAPAGDVDDGQPAMAEADPRLDMKPVAVRAAMRERRGHAAQQRRVDGLAAAWVENAGDAAHGGAPYPHPGVQSGRPIRATHPGGTSLQHKTRARRFGTLSSVTLMHEFAADDDRKAAVPARRQSADGRKIAGHPGGARGGGPAGGAVTAPGAASRCRNIPAAFRSPDCSVAAMPAWTSSSC